MNVEVHIERCAGWYTCGIVVASWWIGHWWLDRRLMGHPDGALYLERNVEPPAHEDDIAGAILLTMDDHDRRCQRLWRPYPSDGEGRLLLPPRVDYCWICAAPVIVKKRHQGTVLCRSHQEKPWQHIPQDPVAVLPTTWNTNKDHDFWKGDTWNNTRECPKCHEQAMVESYLHPGRHRCLECGNLA